MHRSLRDALWFPVVRIPVAGLLGIATLPAIGQDAGTGGSGGRSVSIVPSFSVLETATDNRSLTASDRRSELITQLSPGVHLGSTSGRVQGQLDYSLNGLYYARDPSQNNFQNSLNAVLRAQVVEGWAFVDANASIVQQSISAFGTQSADSTLPNANRSEVGTYSVSPYLRGLVGGAANYEVRGTYQVLHSDGYSAANSRMNSALMNLSSAQSSANRLGWQLALTHQGTSYAQARSTASDRANATLRLSAASDLVFSASAGYESSNVSSVDKENARTWGLGVDWHPSERTRVSATRDKRVFGESHSVNLEYRTPRTVWHYVDSQDISTPAATATGPTQTAYDLLFAQYASIEPDLLRRAELVNAVLASTGIARGTLVGGGFLSSTAALLRRQELSLALTGLRTTTVLSAYQTRTSNLDPLAPSSGELATAGAIRQRGLGVTLSHRLTPESSANASFSLLRSSAAETSLATQLRTWTLGWTTRFSAHTSVSLTARRTLFGSTASPYDESALIAGLTYLF